MNGTKIETLRNLIKTHESWLTERVLEYARAHGYAADSSTLEAPWRASICGFSEPMLSMLAEDQWPPEIKCNSNSKAGPLTEFSINEAHLHRQRGVPLDQFLGLTKYYRHTFQELVSKHFPPGETAERYTRFIDLFFDNAEVGICGEWEKLDADIALRQAAETNLLLTTEKNRYLTIFESLNEPVIIVDDAGQVTNLNLAAALLFDEEAISGQAYYGDNRDRAVNPQVAAMIEHAGDSGELEHELVTRRGTRTFHVKIQRMLDVSKKFTGTVIILSDITDFRAAQRASETANRAKSAFLATMSHEIRTPINGILGISQLLKEVPLGNVQTSYVDALLSSGELLLDLVNDVLDYSKLEGGETELQPIVFSPKDMIERIVQLSIAEAQRKGLKLDVEMSEDCPPWVKADGGKIQRILLNLINNAIKFTNEGLVTITVAAAEGRLDFSVRDTGPGIPVADRDRVFQPFVQSAIAGGEPPMGTGLGLTICLRLADALNARLTLDAPETRGSVFSFSCPVDMADAPAEEVLSRAAEKRVLDILLVEDNEINALVIEGFLETDGHQVDSVTSGEAALDRLRERSYELVLMDIRLQGVDGFETIERIRQSADPTVSALPVLVLTADQTDEVARQFAGSDANAFLAKPFTREELRSAIRRAVASSPIHATSDQERSQSDLPLLDMSVIAEHRAAIGSERTERILVAFLETASHHMSAVQEATRTGDRSAIADIAHNLKSTAEMTGLRRLGRTADSIERRISDGCSEPDLAEMAGLLCERIDESMAALRDLTDVG